MNKVALGGGIVAVLLASYVGGTVYSRGQVAKVYGQLDTEITKKYPMAHISHKVISQGLFSSKVEVKLGIGCGADVKEVFKYTDTLTHGPFLGSHGFGAMYIESNFAFDGEAQEKLGKIFGNQKPLTVATKVRFGGGATVNVNSPAAKFTDEGSKSQVTWGGLKSEFDFTDVKKGMVGGLSLVIPEMTVVEPENNSSFSMVGAEATMKQTGMAGDIPLSSAEFSIKQVSGQGARGNFKAANFTFAVGSNASGDFLAVNEDFGLKNLNINNRDYGPISIKLLFKHLHIPSLSALQKDLEAANAMVCSNPQGMQAAMMDAFKKHGTTLLAKVPEFVIDTAKVKFPEGEASLTAKTSIPGFVEADVEQATQTMGMALLQKLVAEANLSVPEAVVKYYAEPMMGPAYEKNSGAALEAGLVVRKGTDFVINANWANGTAMINGKPQAEIMQKMQMAMMQNAQAPVAAPEGMENLTPEQRAQLEEMMKKQAAQ